MKLIGTLILSIVPMLTFFWKGEEIRQKQKMRNGLLLFLEHTLFQIENFDRDQREIYDGFEDPVLEKTGFLDDVRQQAELSPCGALGRVMEAHLPSFSFSRGIEDVLLAFSSHFGMQSKATQVKELEQITRLIREEAQKEKAETENKIKIMRMTGVTAGLGILILMI